MYGVTGTDSSPRLHCPRCSYLGLCTWEVHRAARPASWVPERPRPLGCVPTRQAAGIPGGRDKQVGAATPPPRPGSARAGSGAVGRGAQSPAQPGAPKQRQAPSTDQAGASRLRGRQGQRGPKSQLKSSPPGQGQLQVAALLESRPWVEWPTCAVEGVVGTARRWSSLSQCQGRWTLESV